METMTVLLRPKPFYRSRLFWLGLPGLMFLLWFWLIFSPKGIFINAGLRSGSILSFQSAIEFTFSDEERRLWEVEVLPLEEADRIDHTDPVFKQDSESWTGESVVGGRPRLAFFRMDYLSMRPWWPSAAYLVVWLGLLWGWQHRKTRMLLNLRSPR